MPCAYLSKSLPVARLNVEMVPMCRRLWREGWRPLARGLLCRFFSVHSAAVGLLNRRLTSGRGRANSLYVLSYYVGGAAGIMTCGYAYTAYGWLGAAALGTAVLTVAVEHRALRDDTGTALEPDVFSHRRSSRSNRGINRMFLAAATS
jgi:hypothetical protein